MNKTTTIIGFITIFAIACFGYKFTSIYMNHKKLDRILKNLPKTSQVTIQRVLNRDGVGHSFKSKNKMQAQNIASKLREIIISHGYKVKDGVRTYDPLYTSIILQDSLGTKTMIEFSVQEAFIDYICRGRSVVIELKPKGVADLYLYLEVLLRQDEGEIGSEMEGEGKLSNK